MGGGHLRILVPMPLRKGCQALGACLDDGSRQRLVPGAQQQGSCVGPRALKVLSRRFLQEYGVSPPEELVT